MGGFDVLIVGGGPVGLTARALLERWGLRVLLVEKYPELSPFPRSRLVNTRSMEIFRQLGLAGRITARAFAPEFGRVRFQDTLFDEDSASAALVGVNGPIAESPVVGVVTSQDRLEPVLLAAGEGEIRFGVELVDLIEETDGVVAVLKDGDREDRVRATYVLAADGANSTVRRLLDIGTTGPGAIGDLTTVVFDAELDQPPAGVYFTRHGSFMRLYPEGGWAWSGPVPEDPAAAVARALGADVPIEVLRIHHWTMTAFVADRFRHGRILLAGDAAHTVPPLGGLGMNAGLADAHNLCWKLAGVLRGWAGPELVETYEAERIAVAERTLRQAVANSQQAREVRRESSAMPWSDRYFAQLDLILGMTYRSTAVLGDDSAPPEPGIDYVPTAEAGRRMPHLWLADGRSTLDTFGEWFTLLTPAPDQWKVPEMWPTSVETLSPEHADFCGVSPQGAVLVRPDGHIAARWSEPASLDDALAEITAVYGHTSSTGQGA